MQFYSFDLKDPIFEIAGYNFSFQIIGKDNIYGIVSDKCNLKQQGKSWILKTNELSWAGQQQRITGDLRIEISQQDGRTTIIANVTTQMVIRGIKIIIHNLPCGKIVTIPNKENAIVKGGVLFEYPSPGAFEAIRSHLPVWQLIPSGTNESIGFYSRDNSVRVKRLVAYTEIDSATIELIHEEDACHWGQKIDMPSWIIERKSCLDQLIDKHMSFIQEAHNLRSWEKRDDLPKWAKDIALVLTIHGMHWSGYVFNTYQDMLDIIKWATQKITGRHILVYLPGWEGRYYWQYGDYRPDTTLGGEKSFMRLCRESKKLGVHLMPMFGGNCANAWSDNFKHFGSESYLHSGTGQVFHGNRPDWDLSRSADTGWQAWLNPGAPAWQDHLTNQISHLLNKYDMQAAFIDTAHVWVNDPYHNVFKGYCELIEKLHRNCPELLAAAEGWYDGLLSLFPVCQVPYNWNYTMDKYDKIITQYVRQFAHLCQGEPSSGSTGVYEAGHIEYVLPDLSREYWPSVSFVENTLVQAEQKVAKVIDQSKEYVRKYL